MTRVSTTITAKQKRRMERTAKLLKIKPSKLLAYALDLYLTMDEQEREPPRKLRR
jgi:hypothetical protein